MLAVGLINLIACLLATATFHCKHSFLIHLICMMSNDVINLDYAEGLIKNKKMTGLFFLIAHLCFRAG